MGNPGSTVVVRVLGDADHLNREWGRAEKRAGTFGQQMERAGRTLTRSVTLPIAGLAFVVANQFAGYERNLNEFQVVAQATTAEMKAAGEQAKKLGADIELPGASAADAAQSMTELAKGGLAVRDSMAAARGTLQLAAAAEIDNAVAAKILAQQINAYALEGKDAARVTDLLAGAANASLADILGIAEGAEASASQFKAFGQEIEDMTTALAIMAQKGIGGAESGTALKVMLQRLVPEGAKARDAMDDLGVEVFDAQGRMRPFRDLIIDFTDATSDMTQEQRQAALQTIFGTRAIQAANNVLAAGVDQWDAMRGAVTREGQAAELAAAKAKGLGGAWEAALSAGETAAIEFGEVIAPVLGEVAHALAGIANVVGDLPGPVKTALVVFLGYAAVLGPAMRMKAGLAKATETLGRSLQFTGARAQVAGGQIATAGRLTAVAGAQARASAASVSLAGGAWLASGNSARAIIPNVSLAGMAYANTAQKVGKLAAMRAGIQGFATAAAGGLGRVATMAGVAAGAISNVALVGGLMVGSAWVGGKVGMGLADKIFPDSDVKALRAGLDNLKRNFRSLGPEFEPAVEALQRLRDEGAITNEAFQKFDMRAFITAVKQGGADADEVFTQMMQGLAPAIDLANAATSRARAAAGAAKTGVRQSGDEITNFLDMTRDQFDEWQNHIVGSVDPVKGALQALSGETKITGKDVAKSFRDKRIALQDLTENIKEVVDRGAPEELVRELADMGTEGASILRAMADASTTEFGRILREVRGGNRALGEYTAFLDTLAATPDITTTVTTNFVTRGTPPPGGSPPSPKPTRFGDIVRGSFVGETRLVGEGGPGEDELIVPLAPQHAERRRDLLETSGLIDEVLRSARGVAPATASQRAATGPAARRGEPTLAVLGREDLARLETTLARAVRDGVRGLRIQVDRRILGDIVDEELYDRRRAEVS